MGIIRLAVHIFPTADTDNEIKRLLTWLVAYVGADNASGLTDVNIYSENFLIPVLNPLWKCSLANLNTYDDQNHPGIDLGDKAKRIAIQVTSTSVRSKITKTIEKFESKDRKEYLNFDSLYVVVLKPDKPKYKKFTTNGKYKFDTGHVLSLNELVSIIAKLQDDSKVAILEHLRKNLNLPNDRTSLITIEDYLVNKFFSEIVKLAKEEQDESSEDKYLDSVADTGDLDLKRERFSKYWSYIEDCYRNVIELQQEKLFRRAFEKLDTSERLQLQIFLARESEKALMKSDNPVEALDIVRKDLIQRASINLLSESQIENYLYYQLYMCKLLPNPKELVYER